MIQELVAMSLMRRSCCLITWSARRKPQPAAWSTHQRRARRSQPWWGNAANDYFREQKEEDEDASGQQYRGLSRALRRYVKLATWWSLRWAICTISLLAKPMIYERSRASTCSTSGSRRMGRGILAGGGTWRRQSRKTHVPDPWWRSSFWRRWSPRGWRSWASRAKRPPSESQRRNMISNSTMSRIFHTFRGVQCVCQGSRTRGHAPQRAG